MGMTLCTVVATTAPPDIIMRSRWHWRILSTAAIRFRRVSWANAHFLEFWCVSSFCIAIGDCVMTGNRSTFFFSAGYTADMQHQAPVYYAPSEQTYDHQFHHENAMRMSGGSSQQQQQQHYIDLQQQQQLYMQQQYTGTAT
jgi:hypothetical protein